MQFTCTSIDRQKFSLALKNDEQANEDFKGCIKFVHGWLQHADPKTGLIPRDLGNDSTIWNAKDAATDNYPFMVLTSYILDKQLYHGVMRMMLQTERKLTARVGSLPDTYSFLKQGFAYDKVDMSCIILGPQNI